jgi:hypothetical protein
MGMEQEGKAAELDDVPQSLIHILSAAFPESWSLKPQGARQ